MMILIQIMIKININKNYWICIFKRLADNNKKFRVQRYNKNNKIKIKNML